MENQKTLTFERHTKEEAKAKGLPTWNNCNHYVVDMSHLDPISKSEGEGIIKDDWMNTIVIKLPNGNFATFCVMQTSTEETCIDAAFRGENIIQHRVLPMGGDNVDKDNPNHNRNIYALIANAKEVK
jgi:hypothetical protein